MRVMKIGGGLALVLVGTLFSGACSSAPTVSRSEGVREALDGACDALARCGQLSPDGGEVRCRAALEPAALGPLCDGGPCRGDLADSEVRALDACLDSLAALSCGGEWPPPDCRAVLGFPHGEGS